MNEQWEYLHVGLRPDDVEKVTNQYGHDGWELVSMIVMRYRRDPVMIKGEAIEAESFAAIFKRSLSSREVPA